ncbi:MAG: alpha-hydroxy-acid oxidizing protein, partial [Solirubrobacterales bacterium]|nr:alpha-hydroxy-acid oxidizing protein [Solirubrobacterales bacterium]
GRQLDAVPSTASALPGIAEAVGSQTTVIADGGVRNGLDMVKMLALGARAVIVGRAWAWAVAAEGQAGVENMLKVLRADADVALALTGSNSVTELGPDSLA